MEPGELPQPGIRTLRPEERGDERISRDDQIREGAELDDPVLVTGRFGVAISVAVGLILGLVWLSQGCRPPPGSTNQEWRTCSETSRWENGSIWFVRRRRSRPAAGNADHRKGGAHLLGS